MTAQPTDAPPQATGPLRTLGTAIAARRGVLTALAVLGGLGLAAQSAWDAVRPAVERDERYLVTPASVAVTPPPAWVRDDVVARAFEVGGLAGELSLLAPPDRLEERLAASLGAHPWVRRTGAIRKAPPNRVAIEVEYRTPLAALDTGRRPLLPIDVDAALLPAGDLPAAQVARLPRVAWRDTGRPSLGDERLRGATALIAALGAAWGDLDLHEVRVSPTPRVVGGRPAWAYEIVSTGSDLISWGAAPSTEPPGEASFDEKLASLRRFVARNGRLNSASDRWLIDVRRGIDAHPRVVRRDEGAKGDDGEATVVK